MKQFNLEEYLANPSRKVVTRDGKNVRIVCTDLNDRFNRPIIGVVDYKEYENAYAYTEDGRWNQNYRNYSADSLDLFFAPEKKEGWINIFKGASNDNRNLGYTRIFKTKENAEEAGKGYSNYITTIRIEWEEW